LDLAFIREEVILKNEVVWTRLSSLEFQVILLIILLLNFFKLSFVNKHPNRT